MARWTGDPGIGAVLEAAAAWRVRCFASSTSILTDRSLWTPENLNEVRQRISDNPITGTNRDFLDKLREQLETASPACIQTAAEVMWFLNLFPAPVIMKAETKREAVTRIWEWSGETAPQSPYLDDASLRGVGHPGTAYLTHRPFEFEYLLRIVAAFKELETAEKARLLNEDAPWGFMSWLDQQEGSDRRLARNALLYFLFPDDIERNLSRDHRQQIYEALKGKLPADKRVRTRNPKLADYDRAIQDIRAVLAAERGTDELDFYQDDIKSQWFSPLREKSRKQFASRLNSFLTDRGLQLNQFGRDTSLDKLRNNNSIDPNTGYWSADSGLTAKPPRWLIHFDLTTDPVTAFVPDLHRARVIGYSNTKGGDSGAVAARILPVAKLADHRYEIIDTWEWLLLFCFPSGLKPGSAAQAFDDFDAATGTLTYMGEEVPYIFSALLSLNNSDETFSATVGGIPKTLTHREATDALVALIHVRTPGNTDG